MGDDELLSWRKCRDGKKSKEEREAARQRMLEAYLPLVKVVVSRMSLSFPSASAEPSDFYQAGVIGLMGAFERFDPDYGVEFRSFASHRIRGQVLDEVRNLDWVPRSVRNKKVYVAPLHSLEQLQEQKSRGEGSSLLDSAPWQEPLQEHEMEKNETEGALERELSGLPPREAEVLSLCYFEGKSLKEIGAKLSFSEARICQIRSQALGRLRLKSSPLAA